MLVRLFEEKQHPPQSPQVTNQLVDHVADLAGPPASLA